MKILLLLVLLSLVLFGCATTVEQKQSQPSYKPAFFEGKQNNITIHVTNPSEVDYVQETS